MKRIVYLAGFAIAVLALGCRPEGAPMQRAYLYAAVDTTSQRPLEYRVCGKELLFPYGKLQGSMPQLQPVTEIHDGYCWVTLEIDRPVQVWIFPVRDTMASTMSASFMVHPGDSLEVRSVPDPRITAFPLLRPQLVETDRRDNTLAEMLEEAFPNRLRPQFEGDPDAYREALDSYWDRKRAFLDSCSRTMPLSDDCIRSLRGDFALGRYNALSSILQTHPECNLSADYAGELELSEANYGKTLYAAALLNRYIRNLSPEPELHYAEIEQGIRRAPRRLRDYLTALQIGFFAERQLPHYEREFAATVERAERTIRDSVLLDYIAQAKRFYANRTLALPDSVLTGTRFRDAEGGELTLGELLARYEGQPLYLDFWASWCTGCLLDMERSANAKAWLQEQGIAYLYVSIDDDAGDWQQACERYGVDHDSYLAIGTRKTPLGRLLELVTIPRYVLFDADHKIISRDAPRPVDNQLPELKRIAGACRLSERTVVLGKE